MGIYTGRGDEGETDLRDRTRVRKTDPRIEAYGTVDEVNALVGRVRPTGEEDIDERLREIQNHLHVVQADLADPGSDAADPEGDASGREGPVVRPEHVATLEAWMDECEAELEPLERFILPGGTEAGAELHHARTVCRRAERRTVELAGEGSVNESVLAYLNRLSDALFTFARLVNARAGVPEESPTY